MSQTGRQLLALLARGVNVTLIRERKHDWRGILERAPVWRYVPVARTGKLDCVQ